MTLAVMQKFVENQGDLWTVALEHLKRLLSGSTAGPQATAESAAAGFHLGRMALLGRRVAEMHHALAKVTGDPAFDPEPATDADIQAWRKRALDEVDAAIAALGSTESAGRLKAVRGTIESRVMPGGAGVTPEAAAAAIVGGPSGFQKTRFHGDLHLGQVLVAQDDFILVDFEGEPERALEQRREKSSVLRDVAGMLRSFSYAAHAAGRQAVAGQSQGGASTEGVARALADWERDASHHFLEGYMKGAAGLASIPGDENAVAQLLRLFLIEKAAYEVRYEIANRPDWVEIPLRGLLDLVNKQ